MTDIDFVPKKIMAVTKYKTFSITQEGTHDKQILKLKKILHHYGPITAAVLVDDGWSAYESGIYTSSESFCQMSVDNDVVPDHQIDLFGYGEEDGKEYIIIRNSWGNDWGEDGFMKFSTKNLCGIAWDYDDVYIPSSGVVTAKVLIQDDDDESISPDDEPASEVKSNSKEVPSSSSSSAAIFIGLLALLALLF